MAGAFTHNGNVVEGLPSIASQINYDNTNSGMVATQVQAAVDELRSGLNNIAVSSSACTPILSGVTIGLQRYAKIGGVRIVVVSFTTDAEIPINTEFITAPIGEGGLYIADFNGNNCKLNPGNGAIGTHSNTIAAGTYTSVFVY